MFMEKKTQYCQYVSSLQLDLESKSNCNQNTSKLLSGYWQTDSKVDMERQRTQNTQHNIEGKEQSWKTNINQLQELL